SCHPPIKPHPEQCPGLGNQKRDERYDDDRQQLLFALFASAQHAVADSDQDGPHEQIGTDDLQVDHGFFSNNLSTLLPKGTSISLVKPAFGSMPGTPGTTGGTAGDTSMAFSRSAGPMTPCLAVFFRWSRICSVVCRSLLPPCARCLDKASAPIAAASGVAIDVPDMRP